MDSNVEVVVGSVVTELELVVGAKDVEGGAPEVVVQAGGTAVVGSPASFSVVFDTDVASDVALGADVAIEVWASVGSSVSRVDCPSVVPHATERARSAIAVHRTAPVQFMIQPSMSYHCDGRASGPCVAELSKASNSIVAVRGWKVEGRRWRAFGTLDPALDTEPGGRLAR